MAALGEDMVQMEGGAWYRPGHALLLAAKTPVSLYRVDGEADYTAISEVLGESPPEILTNLDGVEVASAVMRPRPGARHDPRRRPRKAPLESDPLDLRCRRSPHRPGRLCQPFARSLCDRVPERDDWGGRRPNRPS